MTGGARSLPGIPRRRRTSCAMPSAAGEIGRLEERRLAALEERTDADLAVGRHSDLVGDLETLVAEHPLRERLRAQLMLALYRSRRQAEALEAYQQTRRALVEELGIDPSPELQQLEKAILNQDPSLDPPVEMSSTSQPRPEPADGEPEPTGAFVGRRI